MREIFETVFIGIGFICGILGFLNIFRCEIMERKIVDLEYEVNRLKNKLEKNRG